MSQTIDKFVATKPLKTTKPLKAANPLSDTSTDGLYKQKKVPRDSKGRLIPGCGSLNPGGLPKDRRTAEVKLFKALNQIEKEKGESFLVHYIRESYKDKGMAIALLRKIIPDLKAVEVTADNENMWNIIIQSFKPDSKLEKIESKPELKTKLSTYDSTKF